jgi:hypothetical protein
MISEPEKGGPSRVMQAIKPGFSRRVLKSLRKRRVAAQQELFAVGREHVWCPIIPGASTATHELHFIRCSC